MVGPVPQCVVNMGGKVVADVCSKIGNLAVEGRKLICGKLTHIPTECVRERFEAPLREHLMLLPRIDHYV